MIIVLHEQSEVVCANARADGDEAMDGRPGA